MPSITQPVTFDPVNYTAVSFGEEENKQLKKLLRRVAEHIAARNAMGERSELFCAACNNGKHEACVLPEIWEVLGTD